MNNHIYYCIEDWIDEDGSVCFIAGHSYEADDENMLIDEDENVIAMRDSDIEYYFEEEI